MSLEFNKILEQVKKMGNMLYELDLQDLDTSMELAEQRFNSAPGLDVVHEHIEWVRGSDISGYRGAGPLDTPNAEPINTIVDPPPTPPSATIIAADGSQVYPDEQGAVHYYLLNTGLFVYFHGDERTPYQEMRPELFYHRVHVHDGYGAVVRNSVVDDRRTVREMESLAAMAWNFKADARPLIALYDNRLMFEAGVKDATEKQALLKEYRSALVHLQDIPGGGAVLAGYIDNPFRSKRFVQLLYLLSLKDKEEVKQKQTMLSRAGDLEGLRDQQFFNKILKPGQRSAIMVQNSPQNKAFRDFGHSYEIAFFYLKVANAYQTNVVRIDIPLWVARNAQAVNDLHALILAQCRMQGRNPYPYALTRADELAYIGAKDRLRLEQMVNAEVRRARGEMTPDTLSAKARGKELARGEKRVFEVSSDLPTKWD